MYDVDFYDEDDDNNFKLKCTDELKKNTFLQIDKLKAYAEIKINEKYKSKTKQEKLELFKKDDYKLEFKIDEYRKYINKITGKKQNITRFNEDIKNALKVMGTFIYIGEFKNKNGEINDGTLTLYKFCGTNKSGKIAKIYYNDLYAERTILTEKFLNILPQYYFASISSKENALISLLIDNYNNALNNTKNAKHKFDEYKINSIAKKINLTTQDELTKRQNSYKHKVIFTIKDYLDTRKNEIISYNFIDNGKILTNAELNQYKNYKDAETLKIKYEIAEELKTNSRYKF